MTYRVWGRPRLERRSYTAPFFASMLFAVALGFVPAAQAAPSSDWSYRVRPKDNIWDLAARYLKPDVSWQKLQDYNHVADPLHLPPGMTLHIPVAWLRLEPARAKVVAVIGEATAKLPDSAAPVPVKAGMSFGYGASLLTGNDTSLTLEFADGSRVLVQANSELALDRLSAYGDTGMVDDGQPRLTAYDHAYHTIAWQQTKARLHGAVRQLPGPSQKVIQYHYLHGLAFDQIADILGVSKGRVSQLHRSALLALRASLGDAHHIHWTS